MQKIVILGAGTAGTMMANKLSHKLSSKEWEITIIDQYKTHYYQPGFLFLPFGTYTPEDVKKEGKRFIPDGAVYVQEKIDRIDPDQKIVKTESNSYDYDILIIATGTKIFPSEVEGMDGPEWYKSIFDFYTFEGALALRNKLADWEGGKLVVHISEMPIKCPVAPLEFAFLADAFFEDKGMRDKVDITYVTPLDGAFTKPKATETLHYLLEDKNIHEVTDFNIESVDYENNKILDYGGQEVEYDILVTVPPNLGDEVIEKSGIGDHANFVPTHKNTLQSKVHPDIFAIGDATNLPASKAGSVAHFEAEILTDNILLHIEGKPLKEEFDGHSNCFIETGHGKALLIDFNYTQEPVEGTFPFAGIGPLQLLKESRLNHLGKLAFKWIYWNMLIKGKHIPFIPTTMSTDGKKIEQH